MLADVLQNADNLIPPSNDKEKMNEIIKTVEENCSSSSFSIVESSLIIKKWLVLNDCVSIETVKIDYANQSLNIISHDILACYALNGDLSKIPKLPEDESPMKQRIYSKLISNAMNNPKFDFSSFYVPHWMYECILDDFVYNKSKEHKSLLSLSVEELKNFSKVANFLPGWVFVHAMRARVKDEDIQKTFISIVSFIPKSILFAYFDDFISFIEWTIRFSNSLNDLKACIQSLAGLIHERCEEIADRICSSIDYFNEKSIISHMMILSVLLSFQKSDACLVVFDTIYECLPTLSLSPTFIEQFLKFCEQIAAYEPGYNDIISNIAAAPFFALLSKETAEAFDNSPQFLAVFEACKRFYCVNTSDIVDDPSYNIGKTYALINESLLVLRSTKPHTAVINLIFNALPFLHWIAPNPLISFVSKVIKEKIINANDYVQHIEKYLNYLMKTIQINGDTSFKVLYYSLICIFRRFVKDVPIDMTFNLTELTDDVNKTRINLCNEPSLIALLILKPKQVFILLENWCKIPKTVLRQSFKHMIKIANDTESEILYRRILYGIGCEQPKDETKGWLARDFITNEQKEVVPQLKEYDSLDESFKNFVEAYPNPSTNDTAAGSINSLLKSYRKNEKCIPFLRNIIKKLDDQIVPLLSSCPIVVRFSRAADIVKTISQPTNYICRTLAIRTKSFIPDDPKDFELQELVYATQKSTEEAYEMSSETFASRFLDESVPLSLYKKMLLSNVQSIRIRALAMFPSVAVFDMQKAQELIQSGSILAECISGIDFTLTNVPEQITVFLAVTSGSECGSMLSKYIELLFFHLMKTCRPTSASFVGLALMIPAALKNIKNQKMKKEIMNALDELSNSGVFTLPRK